MATLRETPGLKVKPLVDYNGLHVKSYDQLKGAEQGIRRSPKDVPSVGNPPSQS